VSVPLTPADIAAQVELPVHHTDVGVTNASQCRFSVWAAPAEASTSGSSFKRSGPAILQRWYHRLAEGSRYFFAPPPPG
jgi:hypothetical protein